MTLVSKTSICTTFYFVPHVHLWNICGHVHVPYWILFVSVIGPCSRCVISKSYLWRDGTDITTQGMSMYIIQATNTECWRQHPQFEFILISMNMVILQTIFFLLFRYALIFMWYKFSEEILLIIGLKHHLFSRLMVLYN